MHVRCTHKRKRLTKFISLQTLDFNSHKNGVIVASWLIWFCSFVSVFFSTFLNVDRICFFFDVFFVIIIIIIFVSLMNPFVFSRYMFVGRTFNMPKCDIRRYVCRCFFSVLLVSRHGNEASRIRGSGCGRGDDGGSGVGDDDSLALVHFNYILFDARVHLVLKFYLSLFI